MPFSGWDRLILFVPRVSWLPRLAIKILSRRRLNEVALNLSKVCVGMTRWHQTAAGIPPPIGSFAMMKYQITNF
jgi:hypothetical protein